MTELPTESPADEYDRQLAERRSTAAARVARLAWWSLGLHAAAFGLTCVGCGAGAALFSAAEETGRSPSPDTVIYATIAAACVLLLVWIASFVVAAVSAVATIRRWSLLVPTRRAFGLLPWAVFLAEFTLGLAVGVLG